MKSLKMLRGMFLSLTALGLLALPGLSVTPAFARAMPFQLADLAARLSPAVVNISTTQEVEVGPDGEPVEPTPGSPMPDLPKNGPSEKVQSLGSGFVIDAKGIILTNNHVVRDADKIDVTFTDGTTLPAKLLGADDKTDIAVLKVEPKAPLAHVALGNSDKLRVGDWVMAIGNPFGLGGSVTAGIVSALNRDIHAGNYDDFIQTDAAINRGNSGGPLFDLEGNVVGMNTAIISPSGESVGIGFATPASTIMAVVPQLIKTGKISRGWIGVRIQTVTQELATSLGLKDRHGALVAGVADDGPAGKAGIETGDVIRTFDGHNVPEMRDLPRIVATTPVGKTVKVAVLRGGRMKELTLKVGLLEDTPNEGDQETPEKPQSLVKLKTLGLELVAVDDTTRKQYGLDDKAAGAVISDVDSDSAAADKGLRPGDLIIRIGSVDVTKPQQVLDEIEKERKAGKASVLLRVMSSGSPLFVAVPLK